ncbi:hypothetical protein SUSAZ_05365 [Sulfolobus acidocaldarius SUSAZ]|nr:hypothetical protein SUSAZ_05365 [Sulfolobus acidocaldarius SUSAZ]
MDIKSKLANFSPEKGIIPISIFVDEDIYERELETVFRKTWLFLGFESMIKQKGDYFTTTMGEVPVIVVRDQDSRVRAFIDYCPHKGMKLCRATSGNSMFFRCPYHGWTFSTEGKLVGVPYYEPAYTDILNKEEWGLKEIKNIAFYKGGIWATFSNSPVPLEEFLGNMKLYLDLILDMFDGGENLEVYGGIHRWLIPVNWKLTIENFAGDAYHASSTHASVVNIGLRRPYTNNVRAIYPGNGHGIVSIPGGTARSAVDIERIMPFRDKVYNAGQKLVQKYGEFVKNMFPFGPFHIFPNLSFHFTWNYIVFRVWHPRGPTKTELAGGVLLFKDLPVETKKEIFRRAMHEFGPGGLLEQDDGEVWQRLNENQYKLFRNGFNFGLNYQRGLGMDKEADQVLGSGAKGVVGEYYGEVSLRGFYSTWYQYLNEW